MPTVRHKLAALIGAVLLCSAALLTGGSASALSSPVPAQAACGGYPLSACPTTPPCVVGNVNAGTVSVGKTITFTLCGDFASGASITITANGVVVFTKTPTNGAVTVVVTVASQTVITVGDPVNVAATCGTNTVVATGPSAAGGTGTSTGTFNLLCTSTTTGPLALTGTNVMIALLIALGLIGVGVMLVVFQRRRRQAI